MQHLILNLEAPLLAFGGETIDNYGVIRDFPAASMLTGLLANALGWRRVEQQKHQQLQDRLVFAARIDREPAGNVRLTDFQTAKLYEDDAGWTTRGRPEGREKSPSYKREGPAGRRSLTHLRYRDYYADMRVTVALRLEPAEDYPTLDDLAAALQEPARPLFLGRKPCLPSRPLFGGLVEGDTALAALLNVLVARPQDAPPDDCLRVQWPDGEGVADIAPNRLEPAMLTDQRNWISGLHGGGRYVHESRIPLAKFQEPNSAVVQP